MDKKISRESLYNLLYQYFNIGDSYSYNLTRVKTAFDVGTMGLDDFAEFDECVIEDLTEYIWERLGEVQ